MCIIFGMIERNVACCHACSAPLRHRGEREIGAPADLTVERKARGERSVRFLIIRLFPERGATPSLSLPLYLLCSPLLITFPLLILVVLLRLVRLRSRSIPFSPPVVPFSPPSEVAHTVEVPPSPSRPIPLSFFFFFRRRRRVFPRNRSAVHQFRRDMVARSLEENYRVRG